MLIPVIRSDNSYDYVKDFMLDSLIESKRIVKFKRSRGWVTIGKDPIRESKRYGEFDETNKIAPDDSMFDGATRRQN